MRRSHCRPAAVGPAQAHRWLALEEELRARRSCSRRQLREGRRREEEAGESCSKVYKASIKCNALHHITEAAALQLQGVFCEVSQPSRPRVAFLFPPLLRLVVCRLAGYLYTRRLAGSTRSSRFCTSSPRLPPRLAYRIKGSSTLERLQSPQPFVRHPGSFFLPTQRRLARLCS